MHSDLVVMGGVILPLWDRLHVEKFHELLKLNFVVFATKRLAMHEVSVLSHWSFGNLVWDGVLVLGLFLFFFFSLSFIAALFVAFSAFFIFVFIFVLIFFLFLLFFFWLGHARFHALSVCSASCVWRQGFKVVDLNECIRFWPSGKHLAELSEIVDGELGHLAVVCKISLVVSHVELSESRVSECLNLLVARLQPRVIKLLVV